MSNFHLSSSQISLRYLKYFEDINSLLMTITMLCLQSNNGTQEEIDRNHMEQLLKDS